MAQTFLWRQSILFPDAISNDRRLARPRHRYCRFQHAGIYSWKCNQDKYRTDRILMGRYASDHACEYIAISTRGLSQQLSARQPLANQCGHYLLDPTRFRTYLRLFLLCARHQCPWREFIEKRRLGQWKNKILIASQPRLDSSSAHSFSILCSRREL